MQLDDTTHITSVLHRDGVFSSIPSVRGRFPDDVSAAGTPRRDLLDQPRIAVRIGEREEGSIARAFRIRAGKVWVRTGALSVLLS
jgi:hypothetical protein